MHEHRSDRRLSRRGMLRALAGGAAGAGLARAAHAADPAPDETACDILLTWYRLALELVRHTPTYSPPVASRAFAYLGIAAHEAMAATDPALRSLAGQLNGLRALPPLPHPGPGTQAAVMDGALSVMVPTLFANTGPTGQRALDRLSQRLAARAASGLTGTAAADSRACGSAIADHILAWAASDGGAVIENLGFPMSYTPAEGPAHWVPTSRIALQQAPLLPGWGGNRPFAMPSAASCALPPPPAYSEEPGSAFRAEAEEVLAVSRTLTPEQAEIARFWADDAMLSPTPPGHWISIVMQIARRDGLGPAETADVLARVGIAMADAFIACWRAKYDFNLVRPVTYIRRVLDPGWTPLLLTPPFPEYPSGHSTQSGAAAAVLAAVFGEDFPFEDATHADDGIPPRAFTGFRAAAEEAAMSRLYGGIHFRSAIERGLEQGVCVGAFAAALATWA